MVCVCVCVCVCVMRLWDIGEVQWGGVQSRRPTTKREFLRHLWCKNGGLLKHEDRTHGQKEQLHRGCEGWLIIYHGVGGGKDKGRLRSTFIC